MKPSRNDPETAKEGSLISHLAELRQRLLYMCYAVIAVFLVLTPFREEIFTRLAMPLLSQLPGGRMIATGPAAPFLTPFKLSFIAAVFVVMPVILYQAWAFVAPGLYLKERRFVVPLMTSSIVLFYLGLAFAYFVVFPLMFAFFTAVAPEGVEVMTDITSYLDFVLALFLAFGLAFEVPIATVLLVWTGLVTPKTLGSKRPYVFLGAFVMGMLLTPPDVISQTLLAVPVYLLYEAGLVMSRWFAPRSGASEEASAQDSESGSTQS